MIINSEIQMHLPICWVPWAITKLNIRGFPGGAVVKTSPFNAGGTGSIPGQGAKIYTPQGQKNQNIKQRQYYNKFSKDFKNGPHTHTLLALFLWKVLTHFLKEGSHSGPEASRSSKADFTVIWAILDLLPTSPWISRRNCVGSAAFQCSRWTHFRGVNSSRPRHPF